MAKHKSKTIQYSIYNRDSGKAKKVGDTASYTRPNIEMLSDTFAGAGVLGEIDLPSMLLAAMQCGLAFNQSNEDTFALFAPGTHVMETRWATNVLNSANGKMEVEANKEILTVIPKSLELGDIASNETNEASMEFEVLAYEYILAGKSLTKIDKLNMVFIVNGVDYTEKVRAAL